MRIAQSADLFKKKLSCLLNHSGPQQERIAKGRVHVPVPKLSPHPLSDRDGIHCPYMRTIWTYSIIRKRSKLFNPESDVDLFLIHCNHAFDGMTFQIAYYMSVAGVQTYYEDHLKLFDSNDAGSYCTHFSSHTWLNPIPIIQWMG